MPASVSVIIKNVDVPLGSAAVLPLLVSPVYDMNACLTETTMMSETDASWCGDAVCDLASNKSSAQSFASRTARHPLKLLKQIHALPT
jgi:hypothetical protein